MYLSLGHLVWSGGFPLSSRCEHGVSWCTGHAPGFEMNEGCRQSNVNGNQRCFVSRVPLRYLQLPCLVFRGLDAQNMTECMINMTGRGACRARRENTISYDGSSLCSWKIGDRIPRVISLHLPGGENRNPSGQSSAVEEDLSV
ncbi:hypothetical protein RRG08_009722 [Elysia crispata]|uniref:Uncharacterized protein n=1 Tax=Elysia crispata TaxID=231223 RepID=A0AAE0Y879_9GAST|nr:hypothetical protein RRG08_009722 [Elysia crispata]